MARPVALALLEARNRWFGWGLSAQSSNRELLSRGRVAAELPGPWPGPPLPALGAGFWGVIGLKSTSLMSGLLKSLPGPLGRFPRSGVPWGMLPPDRGEDGSPAGLTPGSLLPLVPPGPRRLERGMPSGLAMGLLPRRASGPSSRSLRRAPKSLAGFPLPWPPALKRLRSGVRSAVGGMPRSALFQSSWDVGLRLAARSGMATRPVRRGLRDQLAPRDPRASRARPAPMD